MLNKRIAVLSLAMTVCAAGFSFAAETKDVKHETTKPEATTAKPAHSHKTAVHKTVEHHAAGHKITAHKKVVKHVVTAKKASTAAEKSENAKPK